MRWTTISILVAVFATAVIASPQLWGNRNPPPPSPQQPQVPQRGGVDRTRLRFRVSARGLKDKDTFGSIDPYVKIYYTENESTKQTKLGRTATLSNTQNPDWSDIFTFEFDRYKRQRFLLQVFDHDLLRRDDKAGEVWVTVSDFVDHGNHLQVNLKKGYLILKQA